ncbi:ribokinase [Kouleothrix sp.]|uniref:ribokinase n=1 Tax=Kouleothrix sp. TaxID=2779161 RepID=UPI0039195F48
MVIAVFGSINIDLVVTAPHLPHPGETLTGHTFRSVPGGKGANQAVACARLGATSRMVGRLGIDSFGAALRAGLTHEGVDAGGVLDDPELPSGMALITVDDSGENTIVVIPGANSSVGLAELARLDGLLAEADVLLLQLEVPLLAVIAAAAHARTRGVTVILDPAPAQALPDDLIALVDVLTPNETEAAALVGFPVASLADAARAAEALRARGARNVVVKRGRAGALVSSADGTLSLPSFPVVARDTVAAGDAFNGGLAVALAEGKPFAEAIRWGLAAGALAVTRVGAQAAMPTRGEVLALLDRA